MWELPVGVFRREWPIFPFPESLQIPRPVHDSEDVHDFGLDLVDHPVVAKKQFTNRPMAEFRDMSATMWQRL